MGRWWIGMVVLGALNAPAHAADPEPSEPAPESDAVAQSGAQVEQANMLDWYLAWAHAVRLDVAPGRFNGRDLGAGGLALQWEWWPTEYLAYTARTWMQTIRVDPVTEQTPPAERQATGLSMGVQVATPGPVKLLAGAGVGLAFVNGRLPPSDRWRLRAVPYAGVLEAHVGVALMARPVTIHAMGWVHLYSEGPAVLSLSLGGGPLLEPRQSEDDGTR